MQYTLNDQVSIQIMSCTSKYLFAFQKAKEQEITKKPTSIVTVFGGDESSEVSSYYNQTMYNMVIKFCYYSCNIVVIVVTNV